MSVTLSPQIGNFSISEAETNNASLSMEELNYTLKHDYIFAHEPFDQLGWQYYPEPEFDLKPPIFDYGIALTLEELDNYTRAHITIPDNASTCVRQMDYVLERLNDMFGLEPYTISDSIPITNELDGFPLLIKLCSNYRPLSPHLPVERWLAIAVALEAELKKTLKWYLSIDNGDYIKDDYSVPMWKLDEVEAKRKQARKERRQERKSKSKS